MAGLEGGCLCGAVRYACDAPPVFSGVCHCRDCQRFTGSAFAVVVGVPRAALTLSGTLRRYTSTGGTGRDIHREFCPVCGSGVLDEADALPGVAMLAGGTLDDTGALQPGSHIFCASAQAWVEIPDGVARFDLGPPAP